MRQAVETLRRAVDLDPGYAPAHAALADAYILLGEQGGLPQKEARALAEAAIRRALELDDRSAEAHSSLGWWKFHAEWNWAASEQAFRRAIELDPNYAEARKLNAEFLSYVGRLEEAIAEARLARRLDPLSPVMNSMLGIVLYRARQYEETVETLREALTLSPRHPLPYLPLGLAYAQLGRYDEAIDALTEGRALADDSAELLAQTGYVYGLAGEIERAQAVLRELDDRASRQYIAPFHFAIVHAGLGETDLAIEWLERGYEQRTWLLCVLKTDPIFDPLRSDERFHRLLRRMNLSAPEA